MSWRDYISATSGTSNALLAEWRWCVAPRLELWLVTSWGDALLRDRDDASIHLLDTTSAEVLRIADDQGSFETALTNAERLDEWLRASLVDRQRRLGMQHGPDECFGLIIAPALGGSFGADNVEVRSVLVHFAVTGQLMAQIRAAPPGARVVGVRAVTAPRRPWWRFW